MPNDTIAVLPSWTWELDVTNDPSSATETWEDITAFVRGATVKRGRQVETGRDQAGTCTLDLDNRDGRFDFFNAGQLVNLVSNPSIETDADGYVSISSSIARDDSGNRFGAAQLLITMTNVTGSGTRYGNATDHLIPVTVGLAYTASLYARLVVAASKSFNLSINWYTVADAFISNSSSGGNVALSGDAYARFSFTATAPATAHHARIDLRANGAQGVFDLVIDGVQFEQASAVTDYVDGDQDNCRWAGTAHASQSYRGGPYYPNFKPMRRIRGTATWDGDDEPLIYAFLDDPIQDYPGFEDALNRVTATDAFKILNKKLVSGDFPAQRSDERIDAILDAVGWPAAARDLAVGVTTVDAITLDKVSALEHIQQVAESESGRFFMAANGDATFIDRHAAYLTTSQATFGEQEINYVDARLGGGESLIYNEILVQRAAQGTVEQSATDTASADEFMPRTLSRTGQHMDSDNEAKDKADFELALYKAYHPRIVSLQLKGEYQPDDVWPQALGRELGDRLTVRKRPPNAQMIEQESFIEWVEHRIGVGTWDVAVGLTSVGIEYEIYAAGKAIFTVGTSALTSGNGVLVY